jgi:hypothetical protein
VKQFFFRHYFGRMGTYSNKQTSEKKWLIYLHREREIHTHAGTQQHRRMRRRPIQSIFDHQNVSLLRCRDDSSGWNSFFLSLQTRNFSGRIYVHIHSKPLFVLYSFKTKKNNSLALPSIIGPGFSMPWVFFFLVFFLKFKFSELKNPKLEVKIWKFN